MSTNWFKRGAVVSSLFNRSRHCASKPAAATAMNGWMRVSGRGEGR